MTCDFLLQPVKRRAETMMALACKACGVPRPRLDELDADPVLLQARQLAAWLMRVRAEIPSPDVAAALGVEMQFVNETCFTVRRRVASRGIRTDGSDAEVAERVRLLLTPTPAAPLDDALPLADCFMAVVLAFGLSRAEMTSLGRGRHAARARHSFCWLASVASIAEPKRIAGWINRGRDSVSYGVDIVAALPGAQALRDQILISLGAGRPSEADLLAIGRRLEALTRNDQPKQPEG